MSITDGNVVVITPELEAYARCNARRFVDGRIDGDLAFSATLWGIRWIERFKALVAVAKPISRDQIKETICQAWRESLDQSPDIPLYPMGFPVLRATCVANEVFCQVFGDQSDEIRKLLKEIGGRT